MKNQSRILKNGSKSTSSSQPKTAQSRAIVRPECNLPCIALFPEGDTSVSEEIIDLSKTEYAALKRAAAPAGSGILMFMANAALEKASGSTSTSIQIAIQVLVDLAVRKVQDCPIDEQICIWQALSKTLPDSDAREHACQIAYSQSVVAAHRLQFEDILSGQTAQPTDQRRAA
jgi:hypothetical protein